jgi:hypothetical protein
MPPVAANANQQVGALQRLIATRSADGKVTAAEAREILASAKQGGFQGGELGLLRTLATKPALVPAARDSFVKSVDSIFPDGAPTGRMAAILFRLDPATGRKQLLELIDKSGSLVPGAPKTYVIQNGVKPYIAAITTGQVITGLTKFMKDASPAEAKHLRTHLEGQLRLLELPVARGGLRVPGLKADHGLALAAQTAQGPFVAINQSAIVLKSLEKVLALKGPQNAALVARARGVADKVATELKAEIAHAYPATGAFSYGLAVRNGQAVNDQLEDGHHLQTTYDALKGLTLYKSKFAADVQRIESRYPDVKLAGAEDLDGRPGHIATADFASFEASAKAASHDGVVTLAEAQRLVSLSKRDGLKSAGEKALFARAAKIATPAAKALLQG